MLYEVITLEAGGDGAEGVDDALPEIEGFSGGFGFDGRIRIQLGVDGVQRSHDRLLGEDAREEPDRRLV